MYSKLTLLFFVGSIVSIDGFIYKSNDGNGNKVYWNTGAGNAEYWPSGVGNAGYWPQGTTNINGINCNAGQEINTLHNNVQQFLISGQQEIDAFAAKLRSFALFWNSTKEQALREFIHGSATFKYQADSYSAYLYENLLDVENKQKTASSEERARLECAITILKADLDSVKSANDKIPNDTRVQAPAEQVQEELKQVFDDFLTTDCLYFDNKMSELLSKMKRISDEARFYGIRRSDELKVKLEAERQKESDDLTQLSDLQNQYKDRVLLLLSFLALEKTNVNNAIAKARDLSQTCEKSKKSCLTLSIDQLLALSVYFEGQINELWPRLLNL